MSGPRKPDGDSKFVIGANRSKMAAAPAPAKPPVIKVDVNRDLGAEERRAAAKNDEEDRRLLDAAAKVTKASIFTRGPGPKDISASPSDDKKPGPKLGGR